MCQIQFLSKVNYYMKEISPFYRKNGKKKWKNIGPN